MTSRRATAGQVIGPGGKSARVVPVQTKVEQVEASATGAGVINEDRLDRLDGLLKGGDKTERRGEPGTNPQIGTYRDRDLRWNETKCRLIKGLQELGADSPMHSADTNIVSEYTGLKPKQVRHYSYHAASDESSDWQIDRNGVVKAKQPDKWDASTVQGGYVMLLDVGQGVYEYYLSEKGMRVRFDKQGRMIRDR